MDSKDPVSLFPAQGTPSPPPSAPISPSGSLLIRAPLSSEDNDSEVESLVSGEDEFETAPEWPLAGDSEEGNVDLALETEDSAARRETLLQRRAAMPIAQLTGDDDVEGEVFEDGLMDEEDGDGVSGVARVPLENPSLVDKGEVLDGEKVDPLLETGVSAAEEGDVNPNLEGNSMDAVLEVGGKEPVGAENPSLVDKVEVLEGEGDGPSLENGVFAVKGDVLLEGPNLDSGRNPNLVENSKDGVLGVAEKEPVEGFISADSVHGGVSGEVSIKDTSPENTAAMDEAVDPEQVNSVGSGVEVVDPEQVNLVGSGVEAVAGGEESGMPDAEDEILGGGSEEATDLKPVEAESGSFGVENDGATDYAGSNQKIESVTVPVAKTLELESSESTSGVGVDEKDKGLEGGTVSVVSEIAEDSADKHDGVDDTQAIDGVGGIDKVEGLDGGSVSVDSEIAKDSADKVGGVNGSEAIEGSVSLNQETGDEMVVIEPKHASTDLEAISDEPGPELAADDGDLVSVQKVESPLALARGIESTETEREILEASDVPKNEDDHVKSSESQPPVSFSDPGVESGAAGFRISDDDDEDINVKEAEEEEGLGSDEPTKIAILGSSETARQIIKELEEGSSGASSTSGFGSSRDYSHNIDGQIASDSDEEVDTDEEGDGKELFDSAALAALLKAATGASSDGSVNPDAARIFSVDRPAGLGSSVPTLRPAAPRSTRPSLFTPSDLAVVGEPENMDEEEKKLQEKVELIRVKFLRLVQRLGHSPEDTVAAQVLYRLGLAEGIRRGRQISRAFSLESARKKALHLEEEGKEDLDFSCNILVLGKSGVGKSATINSIFGEEKTRTNAFEPATSSVKEIVGTVDGVKIRVIDTPGLRASVMDQASNRRILSSIKKYTKRCPPDIVLYVDRLDTQTRDFNDLPLLRSITNALGSSIWFNAIVALTHSASAPPDGPNGSPLSYEVFIAQRSHVVQHSIRQAAGDMRLMNPVALVENHPSCRRNREGERVLPNGISWRPQMLLLCYSSKILSEANSLLKLQDPSPGKLFGFRTRSPPLPFLLSSLLQTRAHPKLSADQGGENGDSDIDLGDLSDSDEEEVEDEYDQLPPFKPLRKSQIAKLTKEQRKAYFDEYDYRFKLLQKKQWKEELRRLKEIKKRGKNGKDDLGYGDMPEDFDQDGAPAAVPVPLPDMVLPPSFDCDNPTYRYRFLEPTSQLLARPVLDTHGWDHDCGYDGVSLEENLAIVGRFPAGVSVQITKDKKEFNIHLDSSVSAKHGENGSTLAGFDIQSVGKQLAYILRGETKFKNLKKNKTTAGISVTFLGENIATGLKIEDQISIGKRVSLAASTGAVRAQGDVAYGANLEARLREKDYPIGQELSTLGLSLMRWRGDLALGANLQSQFSLGRNSKMAVRVGLNNKLSGQITVRTSSSEQLQIALVGILPIAVSIFRSIWPGEPHLVY